MQHLFVHEECFRILTDNLKFYTVKYHARVLAYVFMVNHIHLIIYFERENFLSAFMRDFKKFTALGLRKYFELNYSDMLTDNSFPDQKFKVWEDRFDDVVLYTKKACETKIEYIHLNPVKAGTVKDPVEYKYSSASFYWTGNKRSNLLDYREVFG
jgi:putative transposase